MTNNQTILTAIYKRYLLGYQVTEVHKIGDGLIIYNKAFKDAVSALEYYKQSNADEKQASAILNYEPINDVGLAYLTEEELTQQATNGNND